MFLPINYRLNYCEFQINRRGESVLHLASIQGLATLATALLVAGADPNLQTGVLEIGTWRQTALHLALLHKQVGATSNEKNMK